MSSSPPDELKKNTSLIAAWHTLLMEHPEIEQMSEQDLETWLTERHIPLEMLHVRELAAEIAHTPPHVEHSETAGHEKAHDEKHDKKHVPPPPKHDALHASTSDHTHTNEEGAKKSQPVKAPAQEQKAPPTISEQPPVPHDNNDAPTTEQEDTTAKPTVKRQSYTVSIPISVTGEQNTSVQQDSQTTKQMNVEQDEVNKRQAFDAAEKIQQNREAQQQQAFDARQQHSQSIIDDLAAHDSIDDKKRQQLHIDDEQEKKRRQAFDTTYTSEKSSLSAQQRTAIELAERTRRTQYDTNRQLEGQRLSDRNHARIVQRSDIKPPSVYEEHQRRETVKNTQQLRQNAEMQRRQRADAALAQRNNQQTAVPPPTTAAQSNTVIRRSIPISIPGQSTVTKIVTQTGVTSTTGTETITTSIPGSHPTPAVPAKPISSFVPLLAPRPNAQHQQPTPSHQTDAHGQPNHQPPPQGPQGPQGPRNRLRSRGIDKMRRRLQRQVVMGGIRAGAAAVGSFILAHIVPIVIIIILLLTLFAILGGAVDEQIQAERTDEPVSLSKTGPPAVPNPVSQDIRKDDPSDITYTINVSYSGIADDVIVRDPIPENTIFVKATGTHTNEYNTIIWRLSENTGQASDAAQTAPSAQNLTFDAEKFKGYKFPPPANPNPVKLTGDALKRWTQYAMAHAVKAARITGVDVGILGMWPLLEGILSNEYEAPFYDNCNDPKSRQGKDIDYNPNTPCPYNNWQVGYGVRPMETHSYLEDAMAKMHTGEQLQAIGQKVIDDSKSRSKTPITNPSTFPNATANQIISGAKAGNPQMRQLLGILMKDDAISMYVLARVFKQQLNVLADAMEGWDSEYYNRKKVINHIKAIYDAGVSGNTNSTGSYLNQSFQLTLRPTKPNIYVMNKATAEVIGAETENPQPDPGGEADANDETCNGHYDLTANPLKKNFGDPDCTLDEVKERNDLHALLKERDPTHAEKWFTIIIPCESGYNPNAFFGSPDPEGAWGLLQMGRGRAGTYDHGDVHWPQQISNAISYNNLLLKNGKGFRYWECAKQFWQ